MCLRLCAVADASGSPIPKEEVYDDEVRVLDGGDADIKEDDLDSDDMDETLSSEDDWTVINAFFQEQGLAAQQLASFNEFVENTMQEIVDERSRLVLDQHAQFTGQEGDVTVSHLWHHQVH
jgi:DNA-directed RNA polymerase II subunit RPB2